MIRGHEQGEPFLDGQDGQRAPIAGVIPGGQQGPGVRGQVVQLVSPRVRGLLGRSHTLAHRRAADDEHARHAVRVDDLADLVAHRLVDLLAPAEPERNRPVLEPRVHHARTAIRNQLTVLDAQLLVRPLDVGRRGVYGHPERQVVDEHGVAAVGCRHPRLVAPVPVERGRAHVGMLEAESPDERRRGGLGGRADRAHDADLHRRRLDDQVVERDVVLDAVRVRRGERLRLGDVRQ
jgi:hypothetical protein